MKKKYDFNKMNIDEFDELIKTVEQKRNDLASKSQKLLPLVPNFALEITLDDLKIFEELQEAEKEFHELTEIKSKLFRK